MVSVYQLGPLGDWQLTQVKMLVELIIMPVVVVVMVAQLIQQEAMAVMAVEVKEQVLERLELWL